MKLNNIKAHLNLDDEISFNDARYIFRGYNATFTIHQHHLYVCIFPINAHFYIIKYSWVYF